MSAVYDWSGHPAEIQAAAAETEQKLAATRTKNATQYEEFFTLMARSTCVTIDELRDQIYQESEIARAQYEATTDEIRNLETTLDTLRGCRVQCTMEALPPALVEYMRKNRICLFTELLHPTDPSTLARWARSSGISVLADGRRYGTAAITLHIAEYNGVIYLLEVIE